MSSIGFGNGGRENSHGPRFESRDYSQPTNALVLQRLLADALESCSSLSGKSSARSTMRVDDGRVRVDTRWDTGQVDTLLIGSQKTSRGGNIAAPSYLTDLEIVSSEKGIVREEQARVKVDFNRLSQSVDPGNGRLAIYDLNAQGKVIRSFEPARSTPVLNEFNEWMRDSHGNVVKETRPYQVGSNCRVSYAGRSECSYIVRFADPKAAARLGTTGSAVSLNLTIGERIGRNSQPGGLDIKGVVRTMDGKRTLASVEQKVGLDERGNIKVVRTDARLLAGEK